MSIVGFSTLVCTIPEEPEKHGRLLLQPRSRIHVGGSTTARARQKLPSQTRSFRLHFPAPRRGRPTNHQNKLGATHTLSLRETPGEAFSELQARLSFGLRNYATCKLADVSVFTTSAAAAGLV